MTDTITKPVEFISVVWVPEVRIVPRSGWLGRFRDLFPFFWAYAPNPGGGRFIAVTSDGSVIISPDGITWDSVAGESRQDELRVYVAHADCDLTNDERFASVMKP